jgi:hypothetical protein
VAKGRRCRRRDAAEEQAAGAVLGHEWIDAVMRGILGSALGEASPSPEVWNRIQQRGSLGCAISHKVEEV